jgi:tryptophan-rich sensory protein
MGEAASPERRRTATMRWALIVVPALLLLSLLSAKLGPSADGNPWFDRLTRPALMPPGWVFPAVASILHAMIGVAFAMVIGADGAKGRPVAALFFVVQLGLALAWPPVFFAMHRIMLALGLVLASLLWAAVATLIFWHIRRVAALLMLPWLGWLLLIGLLDWQVHRLNPNGLALVPSTGDTQIVIH